METLGCSTYAVGGWSDGAIAGLLLTLTYPQRVTRMAVWGRQRLRPPKRTSTLTRRRATCRIGHRAPRRRCRAMYGDGFQALWDALVRRAASALESGRGFVPRAPGRNCLPHLSAARRQRPPGAPCFTPISCNQGIAGSRLHVFPDGRHDVHLYYTEAFNELLAEFLLS